MIHEGWSRGVVVTTPASEYSGPSSIPGSGVSEMLYSVFRPTEAAGVMKYFDPRDKMTSGQNIIL